MDHLMNMGKKILKDKVSGGGGHHHHHGGQPNYGPGPDYGYGAPGYGAPGYQPQPGYNPGYNQGYGQMGSGYQQPGPGFPPNYGPGPNYGQGAPYANTYPQQSGHGSGGFGNPMAILKTFDRDGDGNITENDFVIAARQIGLGHLGESVARSTFRKLDKNRNGRLDFNEAFSAIGMLKGMGGGKHHY